MSIRKYALATIGLFAFVQLAPLLYVHFVSSQTVYILIATLLYIIGALGMIWFYRGAEPVITEQAAKPLATPLIILIGLGFIIPSLLLQNVAFLIESQLFGAPVGSENTENIIQLILQNPAFIVATTIAGPIMEEFVFRRAILGWSAKKIGFIGGALLSSALFSLAHADGHFLVYFSLGLLFAGLYKWTGKVWTAMLTHCGMNALVVIAQLLVHAGVLQLPQ